MCPHCALTHRRPDCRHAYYYGTQGCGTDLVNDVQALEHWEDEAFRVHGEAVVAAGADELPRRQLRGLEGEAFDDGLRVHDGAGPGGSIRLRT